MIDGPLPDEPIETPPPLSATIVDKDRIEAMVERMTGFTSGDLDEVHKREREQLIADKFRLAKACRTVMTAGGLSAFANRFGLMDDDIETVWMPRYHPHHLTDHGRNHGAVYYRLSPKKFWPLLGWDEYIRRDADRLEANRRMMDAHDITRSRPVTGHLRTLDLEDE